MDGTSQDRLEEASWRRVGRLLAMAAEQLDPGGLERQLLRVRVGAGELVPERSRILRRTLRRLLGDPGLLEPLARAAGRPSGDLGLELLLLGSAATPRAAEGFCRVVPRCEQCPVREECMEPRCAAPGGPSWWERPVAEVGDEEPLGELLGGRGGSALAAELLERHGGLRKLGELPVRALRRTPGVTPGGARRLRACFELARRWAGRTLTPGQTYRSAREVHQHLSPLLRDSGQEVLLALLLDGRNRLQRIEEVSRGTLTASLAHPREIFAPALRERAAALILCHNHPSGDPSPSPEDDAITERLCAVGEMVGIRVLDHVIVGDAGYVSYLESGRLPCAAGDAASIVATGGLRRSGTPGGPGAPGR